MEHLLTNKSFKEMVYKFNSNMEILCRLLVPLEHGESLSSNHASAIPSFGFFIYHY